MVYIIYLSFVEYGADLCREQLWLTLFTCRSSIVSELASGIGQVIRLLLEDTFSNPFGIPLHGIRLKGKNRDDTLLFFNIAMFCQDGAAQKLTFSNKQDAGCRICMLCKNLFRTRQASELEDEPQDVLAKHIRVADLALTTDELLQSWQRMKARKDTCTKVQFKQWQVAAGLDYSDSALPLFSSLIEQKLLNPCSQYAHDYTHALCSKGALSYVGFWVLESLDYDVK